MLQNLTPTKKGLITGLAMIALALLLFYVFKMPLNQKDQYVLFTVYIAGIAWSLFSYKQSDASDKNFKSYFATGFKTFIVVTLLMVLYTAVFFMFDTSYRDAGIAENNKLLLQQGNHTPAEIESNAKQLKQIFMPVMLGIATFKYLILGALVTAIGSGFLSRKQQ
jgi:membrane-associated HD superfamily phosphohydrolase